MVHKESRKLYEYIGKNVFKNVVTDQLGEVPDELAQKIFAISLEATEMLAKHPDLIYAIKTLDLRIVKDEPIPTYNT